ncbi:uncharacterized protein LOC123267223 [Cotesia glomerata]|uniref:uncharacterized protein LOC123267223 n=1 Tax=Cotesia glomerata TaxID=32391 RepID=UPI001D01832F|nr:uncharacterized protein LOC123267223 [Cotesia glomerata]
MKLSLFLVLVFGLAFTVNIKGSPVKTTRALQDDLDEFMALIPKMKVATIFLDYMRNDAEVQAAMAYIKSEDFHQLVRAIEKMDHVKALYKYLADSGLNIYQLINGIHGFIGMDPYEPFIMMKSTRRTGGMAGLIADIMAVLPKEKFKALYYEKLETSEEFKKLIERLKAPEFQQGIDLIFTNEEIQFIFQKMNAAGVDVKAILSVLSTLLGYEFPVVPSPSVLPSVKEGRTLHNDLDDFMGLLPLKEITEVAIRYLEYDEEVQSVVDYIQSDKFHELVKLIEKIEDVVQFLDYLQESGLNVYQLIDKIHDFIGLPHLPKPSGGIKRVSTYGVAGLIAEIKALLPLEDIKAMYYHKLETSVDFKQLVKRLQSQEFQKIVDTLVVNQEVQAIVAAAEKFGINVKAFADLLSTIFGFEFPEDFFDPRSMKRSLNDDFNDFKALLPLEAINEVVKNYLEHDKEVQSVIEYVQSKDFRELVRLVEEIEDVINFYGYLHESGLDVYHLVNMLHDFLGLPHLTPPSSLKLKSVATNGVAGLIAEIKALLPLEDIKAMYYHKLETSVHFKQLIERLRSPKFQAIMDTLLANQEFQAILAAAKNYGVDVRALADLLSTVFGLEFPSNINFYQTRAKRSLRDDLDDFVRLLPLKEMKKVVILYVEHDEEVKSVIEYVQSKEFVELVQVVESIEDVISFYDYLHESGLNVYDFVNKLHDVIGLPHLPKPSGSLKKVTTNGVAGLIAEIKALLPFDDIKAMYYYKLKTSVHFKQLVERFQSPKFQAIIDTLLANQEFQEIITATKKFGIDVRAIADLLSTMFGLEFPSSSKSLRRSITDHLNDFIVLLPFDKIANIAIDYILNDVEVLTAVAYLKSEEFKDLMVRVENDPEVVEFLDYLKGLGADFHNLISTINDLLDIHPQFQHGKLTAIHSVGGIQGMLNEIRKVIPYEEIKALYEHKIKHSEEFKLFHDQLKSPEFQARVDKLVMNHNLQELGAQAHQYGISINKITEFLSELLGLKFPEYPSLPASLRRRVFKSLNDDLDEFLALVSFQEIIYTVVDYVLQDDEVHKVAIYLRSEEFKVLDQALHQIPEYNDILKELSSIGFNVEKWINDIHSFLGIDPYQLGFKRNFSNFKEPGITGLIEAIKALLPYENIKNLYHEKLETSEDFRLFVELIKSYKFQKLTDTLFANNEFQSLLHKAKSHGINLTVISDFFLRVFGITTPSGAFESM